MAMLTAQMIQSMMDYFHPSDSRPVKLTGENRTAFERLCRAALSVPAEDADGMRTFWISVPRGDISDYGDYNELYQNGDYSGSYEEFVSDWLSEFPDETVFCRVSFRFDDLVSCFYVNRRLMFYTMKSERNDIQHIHDLADELNGIAELVEAQANAKKNGTYDTWLEEQLPMKYRYGIVQMSELWDAIPSLRQEVEGQISTDDMRRFCQMIDEDLAADNKPHTYMTQMCVNRYIALCEVCYKAIGLEGGKDSSSSALDMYRRYADDRDGGMLTIDPNRMSTFDLWYDMPTDMKWKLNNPSHMWEIVCGGSRTRIHLFLCKNVERGYYLVLDGCSAVRAIDLARMYLALKNELVPVLIENAKEVRDILTGDGMTGIVPIIENCADYLYGGFPIGHPSNFIPADMPELNIALAVNKKLENAIQWKIV